MQGKILANGLISGDDGKRYHFKVEDIKNMPQNTSVEAIIGSKVDFEGSSGDAVDIFVIEWAVNQSNFAGNSPTNSANLANSASQNPNFTANSAAQNPNFTANSVNQNANFAENSTVNSNPNFTANSSANSAQQNSNFANNAQQSNAYQENSTSGVKQRSFSKNASANFANDTAQTPFQTSMLNSIKTKAYIWQVLSIIVSIVSLIIMLKWTNVDANNIDESSALMAFWYFVFFIIAIIICIVFGFLVTKNVATLSQSKTLIKYFIGIAILECVLVLLLEKPFGFIIIYTAFLVVWYLWYKEMAFVCKEKGFTYAFYCYAVCILASILDYILVMLGSRSDGDFNFTDIVSSVAEIAASVMLIIAFSNTKEIRISYSAGGKAR